LPPAPVTTNVSPVRDMIIPLALALSPLAPKADIDAAKNNAVRLATIVFRCMVALFLSVLDRVGKSPPAEFLRLYARVFSTLVKAMGEYGPAASNETKAGRADNRRVEVKVLVNKGIAGS
jgi:hypothetical protein